MANTVFDYRAFDQASTHPGLRELTPERAKQRLQLLKRQRWDGLLSQDEIEFCRQYNIPIAYDCAQIGWVIAVEDEDVVFLGQPAYEAESTESSAGVGESPRHLTRSADRESLKTGLEVFDRELDSLTSQRQNLLSDATSKTALLTPLLALARQNEQRVLNKDFPISIADHYHFALGEKISNRLKTLKTQGSKQPTRFSFRAWNHDDIEAYCRILGNPKVWDFLPEDYPQPFTEELAKGLIDVANLSEHNTIFAIEFDGQVIGQIRLMQSDHLSDLPCAEVAYMLDENLWGQGLMTNILNEFLDFARSKVQIDMIYAWIRPDHHASIKTALKAGFVRDETIREEQVAAQAQRPGFHRYLYI